MCTPSMFFPKMMRIFVQRSTDTQCASHCMLRTSYHQQMRTLSIGNTKSILRDTCNTSTNYTLSEYAHDRNFGLWHMLSYTESVGLSASYFTWGSKSAFYWNTKPLMHNTHTHTHIHNNNKGVSFGKLCREIATMPTTYESRAALRWSKSHFKSIEQFPCIFV